VHEKQLQPHVCHTPWRMPPQVPSLDPATHAYSFWEGVPQSGKAAFGRLFAASRTLKVGLHGQRAWRVCIYSVEPMGPACMVTNQRAHITYSVELEGTQYMQCGIRGYTVRSAGPNKPGL